MGQLVADSHTNILEGEASFLLRLIPSFLHHTYINRPFKIASHTIYNKLKVSYLWNTLADTATRLDTQEIINGLPTLTHHSVHKNHQTLFLSNSSNQG